jgi:predicted DNA-binding transcriptional regulator AlpA
MASPVVTYSADMLGAVLHKTIGSIWADLSRAPHRLPPPIRVEGMRQAIWLESTVLAWLQERQVDAAPRRGRPTKRQQIERAARAAAATLGRAEVAEALASTDAGASVPRVRAPRGRPRKAGLVVEAGAAA